MTTMTPHTAHPKQQFHVNEHVIWTHDGKRIGGVVVGIVPPSGSAWLMARMLGYSGSGIRRNHVRVEVGYLVKTKDENGRERVRFPLNESISRCETDKVFAYSHGEKHAYVNTKTKSRTSKLAFGNFESGQDELAVDIIMGGDGTIPGVHS